jgi:hypothetical protein
MGRVDLGNEQRNVGIHAVILGITDDGIACASEIFFSGACNARIEGGKDEIAFEVGIEAFDDKAAGGFRDGPVEMPAYRLGVILTGRAFGRGHLCQLEPRMASEKLYQALAHQAGGAQNSSAPFSCGTPRHGTLDLLAHATLITVFRGSRVHAAPPNRAEPFSV